MKKIIGYLIEYQRKYFEWRLYLTIALFLAVCIAIEYSLDFEHTYVASAYGKPIYMLWAFLFYTFPFLSVALILALFNKVAPWWSNAQFWWRMGVGFGIVSFEYAFYGANYLSNYLPPAEFDFLARCANQVSSLVTTVLPFLLLYRYFEKQDRPKIYYGMSLKGFDFKPYLFLLFAVVLLIGMGSFLDELSAFYPRFMHAGITEFTASSGWPKWLAVLTYELCYGSDFIAVELFFRGFLIFSFVRILGPYVVLPMVATYCFIHFGKPLSETMGSIFGGYILGIIAMNSRNIWGGVMLHLGVAWLMEFFGWLQNLD